jgi:delta 1-pyrroline-5-carboxylate dehydrogenase
MRQGTSYETPSGPISVGLLQVNDQTVADEGLNPLGGRGESGNGTPIGGPATWTRSRKGRGYSAGHRAGLSILVFIDFKTMPAQLFF